MSFKILRITERTHGGDPIARTSQIDADTISVGRGTDCDLQLPDLTIGLRHATMRIVGRGRIVVEAERSQTFEWNGNVVRRAEFLVADRATLGFGSYVLTFAIGANPDEIVVTVVQTADTTTSSDAASNEKAFSVSSVMFSLRRMAWFLGLLILVTALAAPVAYYYYDATTQPKINPDQQWSPGPLSSGHAFLHDCKACHVAAFRSIPDSACIACHQNSMNREAQVAISRSVLAMGSTFAPHHALSHADPTLLAQAREAPVTLADPTKFFVRLFDHPGENCIGCHTEHVGTAGQRLTQITPAHPTGTQVFEKDCANCHAHLKARVPDTALVDVGDWNHHPDFRPPLTTLASNGRPQFDSAATATLISDTGLSFSHRVHLATSGDVAEEAAKIHEPLADGGRLSCAACHRADATGRGFLPIKMTRDCAGCHSLQVPGPGGKTASLPHGNPDGVVAYMRAFYKASGATLRGSVFPGLDFDSANSPSDEMITARIRIVFIGDKTGPHPCADCHTFVEQGDPASLVFKLKTPVKLVDRYRFRAAFDHAVPAHAVDVAGKPICTTCHTATASEDLAKPMIPGIAECKACHGLRNVVGIETAKSDCTECHGYHKDDMNQPPTREGYLGAWKIPDGS